MSTKGKVLSLTGHFLSFLTEYSTSSKTSDSIMKCVMYTFWSSNQYDMEVDMRVTHKNTHNTLNLHAQIAVNKERNIPLVSVPFYQLDEYAESAFFSRTHIWITTITSNIRAFDVIIKLIIANLIIITLWPNKVV